MYDVKFGFFFLLWNKVIYDIYETLKVNTY